MQERNYALNHAQVEQREVSGVLRNTYGLLALTLIMIFPQIALWLPGWYSGRGGAAM